MLTISQIAAIIMLLQAFGVDAGTIAAVKVDLTPSVVQIAPQTASFAPAQSSTVTTTNSAPTTVQSPSQSVSQTTATSSQPWIEVINIGYRLQNMDAPHTVAAATTTWDAASDSQVVAIGVIPHDPDGSMNRTAILRVKTTDPSQDDKTIGWSGTCSGEICYDQYHYVFHQSGTNTIEFIWGNVTKSVTMQAQ